MKRLQVSLAALVGLYLALVSSAAHAAKALRIVLPPQAAPPVEFAARELTHYLAAMGNHKPQIVRAPSEGDIFLGVVPPGIPQEDQRHIQSTLPGRDQDSFILRSTPPGLVIHGNSPRAYLYAAYHYLETLGVRWYFPGPEGELVPRAPASLQGYDVLEVPSFRERGIVIFPTTPGLENMIDFAAKVKLNTIGIHTWHDPKFSDLRASEFLRLAESRGLTVQIERHFFGENFCPDDARNLEQAKKDLLAFVAQMPNEVNDFFLWPADTFLSPCASPAYSGHSVSDMVLWFDSQMLATLRTKRPNARFAYLAYLSTWEPPQRERPAPGLLLEWAPIFQSLSHALDDPASPQNAKDRGNFEALIQIFGAANTRVLGYWLDDTMLDDPASPQNAKDRGNFEALIQIFGAANTRVLGYWLDDTMALGNGYGKLPYSPDALKGDLSYYHRRGVPAVTTFGVIKGSDYFVSRSSPVVFLYPALLWEVSRRPQDLVREFCRTYLGTEKAAEIYDLLAQADKMVRIEHARVERAQVNDPEFIEKVTEAMRRTEALLLSETDPANRARLARLMQEVASRFVSPARSQP